jgi:glycosidase
MRRLTPWQRLPRLAVLLVTLLAVLVPTASVSAASQVVNETGAQPENLNPGYRFVASADTAFGQGVMVEVNDTVANSYRRTACTYLNDTNLPSGTKARYECRTADAIEPGRLVRYQFAVCDYGSTEANCHAWTGFNWSFTASAPPTGDIQWDAVLHDTFDPSYRSIVGPTTPGNMVKLRLRVAQEDIKSARVRVWNDRTNTQTYYDMSWDGAFDNGNTTYDWWAADIPTGANPTALYYIFELNDDGDQDFYVDDDVKFYGGGLGAMSDGYDDGRSFQITVYDPAFDVPGWMQRGVVYQIFPDRFRDGNSANNPAAGRFSYGSNVAIVRSNDPEGDWNSTVCDPREKQGGSYDCKDRYGDNFYGGDLKGITQKIQDGYFDALGVTVLYLNPIFRAPSNHKYDTANFMEIDPDFGTLADFQEMVAAANARGIRIMLDGVFNHTSSDSPYFDRYKRYTETGACEAVSSGYRSWFYFPDIGNAGKDGTATVYCADGNGNLTLTYEAWYGYSSLPKIRSDLPAVRDYFYGGADAVGPYWTRLGASGWRFDVGADVDPGLTQENPAAPNNYWEGFRAAVRNPALIGMSGENSKTVMLGEEWGDATHWLLGNEWDSVMNYRFRSAVLSWLFTRCSGNGCTNGSKFQENDSNDNSSSGAISYVSPSQFNARLRSIQEDYPAQAFKAMMNLAGSHDTQRLRFLLKKINGDDDVAAVQRMKEWWLFAFTYAGAPTLYYGDEVGLSHDGVWDGSQFQDDPYNRTPFPWPDASGSAYTADTGNLLPFARHMASLRHSYRALQDGDVQHGLVIDDGRKLYGFARTTGTQTALVVLNRSNDAHTVGLSGLSAAPYNLPDGTVLVDAIGGASYTVSGGGVNVDVSSNWGAVLLEAAKIEAPAAPSSLALSASSADVVLSWPQVTKDTAGEREVATIYEVHRGSASGFTPGTDTLLGTVTAPAFGGAGGTVSYTAAGAASQGGVYAVVARNAAGRASSPAYGVLVTNAAVRPVLECVVDNGNGTYTARFGYKNDNSGLVTITVGANNRFHPQPQDRGQVTAFQPGRVVDAFRVTWSGGNLVWTLKGPDGSGRTSTASPSSKRCGS